MSDKELLEAADPCPFCGCGHLFFKDGAVACDACQAEGPFTEHPTDKAKAIILWNRRA